MRKQAGIGRAELEILDFVHSHHPVTVREVAEHFAQTKGNARTTILNVMVRLWRKGYLLRRRNEGVFRYSPRIPKRQLLRRLVGDFVDKVLQGNVSPFVAYLAEDAKLSEAEVKELEAMVRGLDRRPRRRGENG